MPSQPCAHPCLLALRDPPLLQLVMLTLIAACGDDEKSTAPPRPDPSLYSVSADQDGDGIPDAEEIRGWTLRIGATGVPDGIIVREVWSDPTLADTDGDGLDDRKERMAGSDPRATDTDGDGLFDAEEVLRFGSNPASVDSDRDAGGAERAAPLPAYFDGAELKLETDPDDPDGPRIPGPGATSPILADTDGDGMWDRDEFLTRSATVAEAPRLLVSIDPRYTATFYLDKAVTETETVEETSSVALSFGGSSEFHFSNTTDLINTIAFTSELEAAVFGSAGVGLSSLSAGARYSADMGVAHSVELTNKTTFGFELSADFSQTFDEQVTESRSRSEVISGARLDLQLLVENVGQVSGGITGLSVATAYVDAASPGTPPELRPLAQLVPVNDFETVVRPGEAVAVQVRAVGLNAERAHRLMANPKGLVLTPATYEVTTAGDENYAFARGTVRARTTALVVQRTDRVPALYQVASNIDRTPHGEVAGITRGWRPTDR
ncbi:MAG TPA: hypothetical protein PK095_04550 [Myxococcota bacterium]|nr:hypothetical protein [Myxococcota bacterium]